MVSQGHSAKEPGTHSAKSLVSVVPRSLVPIVPRSLVPVVPRSLVPVVPRSLVPVVPRSLGAVVILIPYAELVVTIQRGNDASVIGARVSGVQVCLYAYNCNCLF